MADAHKNFAVSLVATAPSPATTGTSLVVTTGHGSRFPTPPFNATVGPAGQALDSTNAEIVRVTAISSDTFTLTRAQEGTTARSIAAGDQIFAGITAQTLTDAESLTMQVAAKASNTSRTTATASADSELVLALTAGTWKIEAHLQLYSNTDGANLGAGFNYTGTVTWIRYLCHTVRYLGSGVTPGIEFIQTNNQAPAYAHKAGLGNYTHGVELNGLISASTSGDLQLIWRTDSSYAGTLVAGSQLFALKLT